MIPFHLARISCLLLAFVAASAARAETCRPEFEFVEYSAKHQVQYMRVHPSGDYVLHSGHGVTIADLSGVGASGARTAVPIKTLLNDEAYPVEQNWNLIASPNHSDGMRYYRFDDLLQLGARSEPVFNDLDHNQFYHSSAELKSDKKDTKTIRTLLWKNMAYRDYTLVQESGSGQPSVKFSETRFLCENLVAPNKKLSVAEKQRIVARMSAIVRKVQRQADQNLIQEYYELDDYLGPRQAQIANPILSKDGTMVAGLWKDKTLVVFSVKEDGSCEKVADLGFQTSKVSFSYPENGKKPRLAFTASDRTPDNPQGAAVVFVHDLNTGITNRVSDGPIMGSNYPGFTKDGRLIYAASKPKPDGTSTHGFVIADLNQIIDKKKPTCRTTNPAAPRETDRSKAVH